MEEVLIFLLKGAKAPQFFCVVLVTVAMFLPFVYGFILLSRALEDKITEILKRRLAKNENTKG